MRKLLFWLKVLVILEDCTSGIWLLLVIYIQTGNYKGWAVVQLGRLRPGGAPSPPQHKTLPTSKEGIQSVVDPKEGRGIMLPGPDPLLATSEGVRRRV